MLAPVAVSEELKQTQRQDRIALYILDTRITFYQTVRVRDVKAEARKFYRFRIGSLT